MDKKKFNPLLHGFVKGAEDDTFVLMRDYKVIGIIYYINYNQGLPTEYSIKKVIHCFGGDTKSHKIFDGRIPTNEFGAELIKNLF